MYKQLKKLPWTAIPATSAVSTGHGRRARRTIKAVLVPAWIEFAGAAQVAQVRRAVTRKGNKTAEVVYLITSGRDADPAALAAWVRGRQETGNRLDWMSGFAVSLAAGAAAVTSPLRGPAAPKTGTPGSAAVVEGHLVAVGVRERESAAERPVDGR